MLGFEVAGILSVIAGAWIVIIASRLLVTNNGCSFAANVLKHVWSRWRNFVSYSNCKSSAILLSLERLSQVNLGFFILLSLNFLNGTSYSIVIQNLFIKRVFDDERSYSGVILTFQKYWKFYHEYSTNCKSHCSKFTFAQGFCNMVGIVCFKWFALLRFLLDFLSPFFLFPPLFSTVNEPFFEEFPGSNDVYWKSREGRRN